MIHWTSSINVCFHQSVDRPFARRVARALAPSRLRISQNICKTYHARMYAHPPSHVLDTRAATISAICVCAHASCVTFFSHKIWFVVGCSSKESSNYISIVQTCKQKLDDGEIKTRDEAIAFVSESIEFLRNWEYMNFSRASVHLILYNAANISCLSLFEYVMKTPRATPQQSKHSVEFSPPTATTSAPHHLHAAVHPS